MTQADQGRRRALLIVPPLMALGVNLHGGWIVGLGVLGIWTTVRVFDWRMPIRDRLFLASAGVAAVAATLVNPYGAHMWAFLGETVRLGRADIEEWGSVLTYPAALGVPWAIVFTIAALAVWRTSRPRRFDYLAIVALLAFASFRVSRLDAFFTLAAVTLLAPELAALIERATNRSRASRATSAARGAAAPGIGVMAITVVAVGVMLVPAARIAAPYASCLTIAGPWVPDAEAGRFVEQNQLKGKMLTWFDWGEYAIWHFGPDLRVSMDGRRETVYTDATIQAHRRFYAADDTAMSYLHSLDPDFIWLPSRLPITARLAAEGWTPAFTGSASVVFARAGAGPFQQVGQTSAAVRCFPGP
jgi:multisubunit Na+/H+ antiporter MnhG subunit